MSTPAAPKQPLIFLHGWTMRGSAFDHLIADLAEEFDCHAPDMSGHGKAENLPLTFETGAATVQTYIEQHALAGAILIGWSMGAAIAWTYCRDYGTKALSGLVSVDMSPLLANGPDWPHGLLGQDKERLEASRERFHLDWEGGAQAIATTMFANGIGAPWFDREAALAQILSNDPDKMRLLWDRLITMDLRDVIGKIDIPFLALFGEDSRVYPASAAHWLADEAPQGQYRGIAGAGHSPHLDAEAEFAEAIRDFADGLASA